MGGRSHGVASASIAGALLMAGAASARAQPSAQEPELRHVNDELATTLEIAGGLVGIFVGSIPLIASIQLEDPDCYDTRTAADCDQSTQDLSETLESISLVTMPLGMLSGVWLTGQLTGGDGGIGWTLLGGSIGALPAVAVTLAAIASVCGGECSPSPGMAQLAVASWVVFPTLGAVIGYELSNDVPDEPEVQVSIGAVDRRTAMVTFRGRLE